MTVILICMTDHIAKNRLKLEGTRSGKLLVISFSHSDKEHTYWNCVCDCGNSAVLRSSSLWKQRTKSCGCLKIEAVIKSSKKSGVKRRKPPTVASFNALYSSYKRRSEKKKIVFELTKEEFKIITSKNCFYCDQTPEQRYKTQEYHEDYVYNGIDRIDSAVGYCINNCLPCCGYCNKAKFTMSQNEFYKKVEKLYFFLKAKNVL